jgi:hypothetical protein
MTPEERLAWLRDRVRLHLVVDDGGNWPTALADGSFSRTVPPVLVLGMCSYIRVSK